MANDPLSADSILSHMADALPTHEKGDSSSDMSSSIEAVALFSHACMVAVGFRLRGYNEEQPESEILKLKPRLSNKWNAGYGSHAFIYSHEQSAMKYELKVDKLGGKAEIRGIGLGDEKITRLEITVKDYILNTPLPLRISKTSEDEEDRSDLKAKLQDIFISPSRIVDLASLFKITIVQKLVPGLQKEGYEETQSVGAAEASRVREQREEDHARSQQPRHDPLRDVNPPPARPYPFNDPLATAPRRPLPDGGFEPPGFDDEYDINRPRGGMGIGGRAPFNIGHDDLNPPGLGPNDPLRGSFVGGSLPRPGGMGGMHPTFDDPLFGGQGQQGGSNPLAPPGSRYDPIGPGDGPAQGSHGAFPGRPGGSNGRPPNPFGGFGSNDFI